MFVHIFQRPQFYPSLFSLSLKLKSPSFKMRRKFVSLFWACQDLLMSLVSKIEITWFLSFIIQPIVLVYTLSGSETSINPEFGTFYASWKVSYVLISHNKLIRSNAGAWFLK